MSTIFFTLLKNILSIRTDGPQSFPDKLALPNHFNPVFWQIECQATTRQFFPEFLFDLQLVPIKNRAPSVRLRASRVSVKGECAGVDKQEWWIAEAEMARTDLGCGHPGDSLDGPNWLDRTQDVTGEMPCEN